MSRIRLHRQSCEQGRLPRICVCCGAPATRFVSYEFRRTATLSGRMAAAFGESITLPVPVCNMHRWYLNRYIVVVWVLAAILGFAAVVLVPLTLWRLFGHNQVQQGGAAEMLWLIATILLLPMVVIVIRLPRVRTVWALDYTAHSVDLAGVDAKFVEAVQRTNTSTSAGKAQPMGVALPSGDGLKLAAMAVGAAVCLVSGICVLGLAMSMFAIRRHPGQVAQFQAAARQRRQQLAEMQQKAARNPPPPPAGAGKDAAWPPSPAAPAPGSGFTIAPADAAQRQTGFVVNENPKATPAWPSRFASDTTKPPAAHFEEESPATGRPESTKPSSAVPSAKRLEEFTPTFSEPYPPDSREIEDTSELRPGMEVWVHAGRPWHRCTVTQVEDKRLARVRLPASVPGPSERPIPAVFIRIPSDMPGSRSTP